ncbi:hypothetical protein LAZ67_13000941 [Cordylochernes scorpioides]|uniref:Uncharacterized protein n=1 Tax=Cordylochernes scorpioides TaxID=51811 RepID=A0ABY6L5V7_9ARAC|nr:hypothetical protein LAZ67_13000941 [Cordylochernes scorpioides]
MDRDEGYGRQGESRHIGTHRATRTAEWLRVVFSDKSRFCFSGDSHRVRVWRHLGDKSNVERRTSRRRGIMVWGTITYDSKLPLIRIESTMTVQQYVDA